MRSLSSSTDKMNVTIQHSHWKTKLGETNTGMFVLAYNYALLQLIRFSGYSFPGFLMLDFPIDFADSDEENENYLVKPFCDFGVRNPQIKFQVIVAGRAFKNLRNAHRLELTHVWK